MTDKRTDTHTKLVRTMLLVTEGHPQDDMVLVAVRKTVKIQNLKQTESKN